MDGLEGIEEEQINPLEGMEEAPSTLGEASPSADQPEGSVDSASEGGEESEQEELDPEVLSARYQDAVKGIHEKGQEASQLKRERDLLQQQIDQLKQGLQDPNVLQTLHEHARRVSGDPGPAQRSPEDIERETGIDAQMQQSLASFIESLGYLRRDDPKLVQYEGVINYLANSTADTTWKGLTGKYPDAEQHKTEISGLMTAARQAGMDLSLEQAYHGITSGTSAVKAERAKAQERTQAKVAAQLPRQGARGVTSTKPKNYENFEEAFDDAMREHGITEFGPRGRA